MTEVVSLVIVGAGPAGLAAAQAYHQAGGTGCVVLDAGGPVAERQRHGARDVVQGVGGAGLYSDGKFSFYPAARALWSLPDALALATACAWTGGLLRRHGLAAPALLPPDGPAPAPGPDGFKPYPSIYMPLADRTALIEALSAPLGERLRSRTRLVAVAQEGQRLVLELATASGSERLRCKRLIAAGGRLFPLLLREQGLIPTTFRRIELGVRIEGPAGHRFFAELLRRGRSLDPKLIVPGEADVEWRTFCCCTDGEVVQTEDYGLRTLSGRADCPPTGRSNVGFNVRFRSAEAAGGVDLARPRAHGPFAAPLSAVFADPTPLVAAFGPRAAGLLQRGLRLLAERIPSLRQATDALMVRGPTVEGVGDYPAADAHLSVPGLPIQLAGDCGGVFRGIVAALVSGHYAGRRAAQALENEGLAYSARP